MRKRAHPRVGTSLHGRPCRDDHHRAAAHTARAHPTGQPRAAGHPPALTLSELDDAVGRYGPHGDTGTSALLPGRHW